MSWWWFPIEDGADAETRQFQIQDFLHQVTDVLDACVPLHNWYVDSPGYYLSPLGPYTVGVTNAQGIWAAIQTQIEKLVEVFYDYASIYDGEWFAIGSEDGPRATPGYMHYNVYKKFKALARAVDGIPTDHKMRQEDEPGPSISFTVPARNEFDETIYEFDAGIEGFKWDSVTVTGGSLTRTYYDNMNFPSEPNDGYYAVRAWGNRSQDGAIYFSRGDIDLGITITYRVDTTGFGWTRRIDDEDDPPADPPYVYADGSVEDGDVIHACLLNQIYACTVVLQNFAVLVDPTHDEVNGATVVDSVSSWSTHVDGEEWEVNNDDTDSAGIMCDKAMGTLFNMNTGYPYDGNGTGCYADAGHYGTDYAMGWGSSSAFYALKLTDLPLRVPDTIHEDVTLNVKDFVLVHGGLGGWAYASGVNPMAGMFLANPEMHKIDEVVEFTAVTVAEITLDEHGEGDNPIGASTVSCRDGCDDEIPPVEEDDYTLICRTGDSYSASGLACIQLNIPNPTSSAP
jgi:hypothetical protein